jgi:DNA-binding transcriptional LysR family regulator
MPDPTLPFDLRTLEVFLAVCEAGAMARAARVLGITQSAVSQTVAELEARTGTLLFDRAVRPLGLTGAGLLLRQRAGALLTEARQIGPLLREAGQGRLRQVRLGLVDSLERALVPALSAHLAATTEEASFHSGLTASHASALLTRQIDIVLGADELEELDGIERWTLCEEPYLLIAPAGVTAPRDVAELWAFAAARGLVRFSARSKTGLEVERHLRRLGLTLPRGQEFDTPLGLTAAVALGQGWAVTTPLCLHGAAIPWSRLRVAPLPGPGLARRLTLIARRKELGRLPRALADVARGALRETAAELTRELPWLDGRMIVGASPAQ